MNTLLVGQQGLVWVGVLLVVVVALGAAGAAAVPATVPESARKIPVAYDVDVVVVGGGVSAVAAATAAAKDGAKVFLAAPRPYLGQDLAGTLLGQLVNVQCGRLSPRPVRPALR